MKRILHALLSTGMVALSSVAKARVRAMSGER
jgi:hypothetical protein